MDASSPLPWEQDVSGNERGSQVSRGQMKHVGGERESGGGDRLGEGPGEEAKRVRGRV